MKLVYSDFNSDSNFNSDSKKKKRSSPDIIAGFCAAFLVNGLILLLTAQDSALNIKGIFGSFVDVLPWVVNSLFLLVFMLILPRFALGYLLGIAVMLAIPILGMVILVAGCLLLIGLATIVEDPTWWQSQGTGPDLPQYLLWSVGLVFVGAVTVWGLRRLYDRFSGKDDNGIDGGKQNIEE
jgi:hypothetical protein